MPQLICHSLYASPIDTCPRTGGSARIQARALAEPSQSFQPAKGPVVTQPTPAWWPVPPNVCPERGCIFFWQASGAWRRRTPRATKGRRVAPEGPRGGASTFGKLWARADGERPRARSNRGGALERSWARHISYGTLVMAY